jgi:hypothetical protein
VANGSGLSRGKQELGLIGGQQIGQEVWDSFGIGRVAPVLDPVFLPQNISYVNTYMSLSNVIDVTHSMIRPVVRRQ